MYCDNCIHKEVCGKEGCNDPAMVFCDDMITEAIPFEWIRKYMGSLPDGGMAYECILAVLERWETENATS